MKLLIQSFLVFLTVLTVTAYGAESVPVRFVSLTSFSKQDEAKIYAAGALLEHVLSSDEFKAEVLKYPFIDLGGASNEEIYSRIMSRTAEFDLELYMPPFWKRKSVVGYTNPGNPRIFLNRYYFDRFELADIAANLAHEWTHKLGFDHDYKRTARRPRSVPYAIGEIVERLAASKPL